MQVSANKWDGFARLAHSGKGVIAVFRNKSQEDSALVQLPVMPVGMYKLHSVISGKDLGVFRKADWERGVPIRFPDASLVEIIEVTLLR